MSRPVQEQIEALLDGRVQEWAVANGAIRPGEWLIFSKIFTISKKDVLAYLQTHPVPGVDKNVAEYQGKTDGPRWMLEDEKYIIGWRERGIFTPEYSGLTESEFRSTWIEYLAGSFGLPL